MQKITKASRYFPNFFEILGPNLEYISFCYSFVHWFTGIHIETFFDSAIPIRKVLIFSKQLKCQKQILVFKVRNLLLDLWNRSIGFIAKKIKTIQNFKSMLQPLDEISWNSVKIRMHENCQTRFFWFLKRIKKMYLINVSRNFVL